MNDLQTQLLARGDALLDEARAALDEGKAALAAQDLDGALDASRRTLDSANRAKGLFAALREA
jgi:hypothetical protein